MGVRTPNTECRVCGKPLYRRPWELEKSGGRAYCCKAHYGADNKMPPRKCKTCSAEFQPVHGKQTYCSKRCTAQAMRGPRSGKGRNRSTTRLLLLQATFNFASCMVEGCSYDTCYDIHRVIPGNKGGQYEIGNMFAICPNHHAEVTRNLIDLVKIDDQTLRKVKPTVGDGSPLLRDRAP